ncbi:transporter, major facilitator family protein [Toxoplasma gondii TgCatPRC2]|uniref:Transmembrane domian-containing protein n=7 Tax=Toxoplasma gondii TaxID=5811 RepID=B6KST5_TOXGV|nr:transporter, major facilitator family protein [Toxoplasma gondii ME49]ESS28776.1 transporter, major facilitator family protein [Toxoplasma gondii VEG]KFG32414.1 transporter, major facilitator family protein [Toxoplasma gondii GAB2-2007-GAL-DOM2]KFG41197.1 transporter, major facilitator family protein [Toxoplasma gondii FOU]KYF38768.1 transporter, major facilitator family protein [Toxoplasma gondii ARI]KYK64435.1 transporter, major facilitator family protein [Toxoplasma gondii TgCatPRC2]PUA|eukprot:XP_002370990.1 transporter, major facilitator family protein [Toxoplasma gondii ME49]
MASEPFIDFKPSKAGLPPMPASPSQSSAEDEPLVKSDKKAKKERLNSMKTKSLMMVNASAALDGCDDQLLPATFRALERDLSFHPSLLGYITLAQTMCLSLLCPVWGYLSDRHSRKWLLAFGTFAWGLTTTLLGLVSDFWQVTALRALNGVFLGSVGPISQSILADTAASKSLGFSFGLIQLCSCIGRLVGGVVTTSVALLDVGMLRGWRVCFFCVGGASMVLGLLIAFFLEEIPRKKSRRRAKFVDESGGTGGPTPPAQEEQNWLSFFKDVFSQSLSTPSIVIILAEGLLGTVPWSAFSFNTMYFQYCAMSDLEAAVLTGSLLMGAAAGGVLGGLLGDRLFYWSRGHGRPLVGQVAMMCRIPLLVLAYVVVPKEEEYFYAYFLIALFVGFTSMSGVAVNRPILSDVVRPDHKGTVFAVTVALEGSSAAILGAPLVGVLAESAFGYERTSLLVKDMPDSLRLGNASALAKSLFLLTVIPWSISFVLYGMLHFTYERDQIALAKIVHEEYEHAEDDDDVAPTDASSHATLEDNMFRGVESGSEQAPFATADSDNETHRRVA